MQKHIWKAWFKALYGFTAIYCKCSLQGGDAQSLLRFRGLHHVLMFVVLAVVGWSEEEQEEPQLNIRDSLGKRLGVVRGE